MLYTAAYITAKHNRLTQAIWNAESQTLWPKGVAVDPYVHYYNNYWRSVTILAEDGVLNLDDPEIHTFLSQGEEILSKVGHKVKHILMNADSGS